jgi:hypothetical protein
LIILYMSSSTNINRLQTFYNELRLDNNNISSIRTLKKDILNEIQTCLTNGTQVTDLNYMNYKDKKRQLDNNQSLSPRIHNDGVFHDLTTFTDPNDSNVYYPYMFGKTLRHNTTTGFVRKDDVDSIINVLKYNDASSIAGITYDTNSVRKIEGLFCSNGVLRNGDQTFTFGISNSVGDIDSKASMFEMMEVYAQDISRDQPYHTSFWDRSTTLTGTATPTASTTLTGSGTQFQTAVTNGDLAVGDSIEVDGQVREVASITSQTALVVTVPFQSGSSSSIKNISRKVLTGSIDPIASTTVTGSGTLFTTEVALGDRLLVSGETKTVIGITSNTLLLVDTAFSNNANDTSPHVLPLIGNLVTDLNKYNQLSGNPDISARLSKGTITPKTLFRGISEDEQYGPYMSQLLLKPFQYGNTPVRQFNNPDMDPLNTNKANKMSVWLDVQRGIKVFNAALTDRNTEKYAFDGRILGSIAHNDPLFSAFYNAAMILNQSGVGITGFGSVHSSTWIDSGAPAVLAAVADVATHALRVCWYAKYDLTMRIRPEVLAQRVMFASQASNSDYLTGGAHPVPKLSTIKTNAEYGQSLLTKVNDWNVAHGGTNMSGKNYFLNMQYEEGSPTHPSLPAGHAVVAGACTTVLKAMVITRTPGTDNKILWVAGPRTAVQADATGDNLISYAESDASSMTVIGELNKLASNMSLGRNTGGVHYRLDGYMGMRLGEDYAITYLQDRIKEYGSNYNGLFKHYDLTKFDGTRVRITATSVTPI